jgi:nucleoside phosphorylase
MMKILVTCAVDPEFAPWRKLRKFQEVAAGELKISRTEIGGAAVDFIVSGMGPAHAKYAMYAVASNAYEVCIVSGLAGALRPDLGVGDVIVPRGVRQVGGMNLYPCDRTLVADAAAAGGKAIDSMISSDRIATTVEEKARLGSLADAVDMESYTVLAAARERSLAAVVIRAVSDRHDQAMPVDLSTTVDERGQVSIGNVLKLVAGNPLQIAAMMKLGRESKAAAEVLAKFLDGYIERISQRHHTSAASAGAEQLARREA